MLKIPPPNPSYLFLPYTQLANLQLSICAADTENMALAALRFRSFFPWALSRRAVHSGPRIQLLKQIYAPFQELEPKSPEYTRLAKSGKCWQQYFDPGNPERYGYAALQEVCTRKKSTAFPLRRFHVETFDITAGD